MAPSKRRLLSALAGACVTSLMLACNGIIGLSDYTRGECSGGGVCEDAGDVDVVVVDASDGGPPDAKVDASGTKAVRWAQFKMPNYAQDGGPGENVPKYNEVAGGFQDSVSELVWGEPILDKDKGGKSYEDALRICAAITSGGSWRLPSRIELVTLLDLGRSGRKIDEATFKSTEGMQYWTTSEVRPDVGGVRRHWTVDFSNGGLGQQEVVTGQAGVRCIKDR